MATYKVSKRIGRGGMADVFLGMQEGVGGFEKLVVVKRIFEEHCNDNDFVSMFLEEARLAASVQHQNVVHVLDLGQDNDGYYIVMEYLSGETCSFLFDTLKEKQEPLPPHIACRITAEIAAGLHKAHTATDAAGNPQPLVHRDVTPSNLIVGFDGSVKIVDFGVAKATLADRRTQAGCLKGKMSYLAPEQVEDLPIDGRADVFQLGICLHELITGQRLFSGGSDHDKMLAVLEKPIPLPSSLARGIPLELDSVVMKALDRDPDKRYKSADAFRKGLEGALAVMGERVSTSELSHWMKTTFSDRLKQRARLERECVSDMRLSNTASMERRVEAQEIQRRSTSQQINARGSKDVLPVPLQNEKTQSADLGPRRRKSIAVGYHGNLASSFKSNSTFSRRHGVLLGAVLFSCLSMVGGGLWYLAIFAPQKKNDIAAMPAPSTNLKAGNNSRNDNPEAPDHSPDGRQAAPDIRPNLQLPALKQEIAAEIEADARKRVLAPILLAVNTEPQSSTIQVDGKVIGVGEVTLALARGPIHEIVVSAEGHRTKRLEFLDIPPQGTIQLEELVARQDKTKPSSGKRNGKRESRNSRHVSAPKVAVSVEANPPSPQREIRKKPKTENIDPWSSK